MGGWKYALPTEAQWEYSCRAGTTSPYFFDEKDLNDHAWYVGNSGGRKNGKTQPVALKKANAFGLYDMAGNVWEWTADWYDNEYYKKNPREDPLGPSTEGRRLLRGGSWNGDVKFLRSAYRHEFGAPTRCEPFIGFRVVILP